MAEQPQRTRDEVKGLLERGTIADLERLIANSGRKNRAEFAAAMQSAHYKNSADLSCYTMIFVAWCYRYLNCMKRQVIHS